MAGGIDPERPSGLAVEIAGQPRVDDRKPWRRSWRRQLGIALDADPKVQAFIDQSLQVGNRLWTLVGAVVELDDHGNFTSQGPCKDFGDAVPMPVEDDADHDALQKHYGNAQNEERALIEPGRKIALQHAVEAPVKRWALDLPLGLG